MHAPSYVIRPFGISLSGKRYEPCEDVVPVCDEGTIEMIQWGNDRREDETRFEAQEGVRVAAEDGDAIQNVGILRFVRETEMDGEGGAVARFLRHLFQRFVE